MEIYWGVDFSFEDVSDQTKLKFSSVLLNVGKGIKKLTALASYIKEI